MDDILMFFSTRLSCSVLVVRQPFPFLSSNVVDVYKSL